MNKYRKFKEKVQKESALNYIVLQTFGLEKFDIAGSFFYEFNITPEEFIKEYEKRTNVMLSCRYDEVFDCFEFMD